MKIKWNNVKIMKIMWKWKSKWNNNEIMKISKIIEIIIIIIEK